MAKKSNKIKINEERIKVLNNEVIEMTKSILKYKDLEDFLVASSKRDAVLMEIYELKQRNLFILRGQGPNGVAEIMIPISIPE